MQVFKLPSLSNGGHAHGGSSDAYLPPPTALLPASAPPSWEDQRRAAGSGQLLPGVSESDMQEPLLPPVWPDDEGGRYLRQQRA